MNRSRKRMNRILAIILAGVIVLSNDSILTAFATADPVNVAETVQTDSTTGDDGQSQSGTTGDSSQSQDDTAGDAAQSQSSTTGDDSQSQDDTVGDAAQSQSSTTGDGSQSQNDNGEAADTNATVSANVPGGTSIPDCMEDKTHEYEELVAEDGTVTGYRCVFCQREIDAETFSSEAAVLHEHTWIRPEGELVPICDACSAERLDCEAEDGYGVHIFELIQEEGQADKYRCLFCGYEKEMQEEWDLSQEQFLQIMGISPLGYTLNGETSSLPTTITELQEAEANGYYANKTFNVENLADLAALQLLSNDGFEYEGYTINFVGRKYAEGVSGDNTNWDLSELPIDVFSGLGTEEHPFKGTLTSYYTGGSLRFTTVTPLLNYVATGATVSELQVNAAISGDGSSPVGIIAAHVVAGTAGDTVSLANLSLSGTVTNNGGAAGVLFGEVVNGGTTPIKLCYEQSDVALHASVTAAQAGSLAGQTTGKVEVYQGTLFTSGSISGSTSAGMLVGTINTQGILYIGTAAETTVTANVSGGGASGGLVGMMDQGEILRADGKTANVIVSGSVGGATAGGLFGQLNQTSFDLEHITINAGVSANGGTKLYAGGVIGQYIGDATGTADSTQWRQLNNITVNGSVAGGESAGGVVGLIQGSNFRIGTPDATDCVTIKGSVSASKAAGGVIGTAQGQFIEVYSAAVSNTMSTAAAIGGIIGVVGNSTDRTVVLVKDAKVSTTLSPGADNKIQGGIFGNVTANSMTAMDGTIDVSGLNINNTTTTRGHIVGKQTEALVYFEEACSYTRPQGKAWVDDIGSYGGIYRNGSWGETDVLISYAAKDLTGTVTKSGSQWVLDTEADMMRFAIMLNTQGRFAASCFSGTDKATLLAAEYSLCPADGSFDLEQSGIFDLNRNDSVGKSEYFTGKLSGTSGSRVILKLEESQERITRQDNLALFPAAGNGAVFENLQVVRNLRGARNAAGLAIYGVNDTTVTNVDVEMTLTGSVYANLYYYGGYFADYTAAADTTLTVENCKIGGSITISQSNVYTDWQKQRVGGMIAEYRSTATGSNLPVIKISNLELAQSINSTSRLTSGMITHINGANTNPNQDKVVLAMDGIHIRDGAQLIITDDNITGGLLGRMWYDVAPYKANGESYSIKNLIVGDDTTSALGPYYESNGWFGGVVHTVTGRIQLKDTKVQNGRFHGKNRYTGCNGLLFWSSCDALIELEGYEIAGVGVGVKDIDYTAIGEKIAITGTTTGFSDIVGNTFTDLSTYGSGGIVNIISQEFDDNMVAYSNHLMSAGYGSTRTRYYYNLFGTSLAGEDNFLAGRELDASNLEITDADQMMIWHLTQYMNSSIRRYLKPYYKDETLADIDTAVTIKGKIDLAKKSYYPTPVHCTITGLEQAEIVFYGDKITEGTTKTPNSTVENYMLHAGLLISHSGDASVYGDDNYLTLSGTVSNLGVNSGALFVRTISGIKNIYKIRLKDLYINDYDSETDTSKNHGRGLMIGHVGDGSEINISWIETEYASTDKKAAASLIGQVGENSNGINSTTDLRLDFTNIKVDDKVAGIFRWSSLIDKHFYTDTTEENKGRVRYLFTEEAYRGTDGTGNQRDPFTGSSFQGNNDYSAIGRPYVTIGAELKDGVEYWNVDGKADFLTNGEIADWSIYLPYVCTSHANEKGKDIEVNPKNTSITEGCGTYEDPYQISNAKQLLALSRYLINKDDARYLEDWQIRKTGSIADDDGDLICDKGHSITDADLKTYGDADFPTQDDLRQAYYIITADIDFTTLISATDRNIAQEYVGLGTSDMPFSGVIVGQKDDGTIPTIILPHKKVNNYCTNFGLVQFAKGAVIKDLIITSQETTDAGLTDVVRVSTNAGSVIACVLGGDNIIDNVTVSNKIAVQSDTAAGGYVGNVRQGSLILRNMGDDKLSSYQCGTLDDDYYKTMTQLTADDIKNYPYVSGVVGKVENGFVIYEDSTSTGSEVLAHEATSISGVYSHSVLPLSQTYDIITESGMSGNKVVIASDGTGFKGTVANAAQLQLVSMAINSDAFSVYYDQGGYDRQAVCRKADYDEVGNVKTSTSEYELATKKDDKVYWYPYIYQYFTFNGVEASASDKAANTGFYSTLESYTSTEDGESGYRSQLNAVTSDITAAMTYELVHNNPSQDISVVDYDLSVYRRGFRGLGATYRIYTSDGETTSIDVREDLEDTDGNEDLIKNRALADFRANFNGNGATVKAEMVNDYEKRIHTTALFNDLVNITASNDYYIKDLVVTGSFINYVDSGNYSGDRAAAVAGIMRKPWEITNVTALDVNVYSKGHAAGIVAWISPLEIAGKKAYTFEECKVLGANDADGDGIATSIHTIGGSCGAIVGAMAPRISGALSGYALTLKNCQVSGTKDASDNILYVSIENDGDRSGLNDQYNEDYARGRSGGLVGFIGKRQDTQGEVCIDLTITDEQSLEKDIQYVAINGGDSTGGVLGEYYGWRPANDTSYVNVKIDNITVADSKIESKNKNCVAQEKLFGIGGIIGKVQKRATCEISSCKVQDTDIRSLRTKDTGTTKDLYAGGVIGFCYSYSRIYLDDIEITGTLDANGNPQHEISTKYANVAGLIGSFSCVNNVNYKCYVKADNCQVSGMKIAADNRTADSITNDIANGTSNETAGGLFGWATTVDIEVDTATVKDCVIQSGINSVGGVIGAADTYSVNTSLNNIVVDSCKIGNNGQISKFNAESGAGGVYGLVNNKGTQKLKKITIKDSYIYGKSTGGIAGYVKNDQQIGNVWSDGADYEIKIQNNYLFGYAAGGAFGVDSSKKLCFNKVNIEGNTIVALRNDNTYSAAGGFCGLEGCGSELKNLNNITVKDNHILSGHTNKANAAGAMFGYITLNGKLYCYGTVAQDNAIGYYDVADDTTQVTNLLSNGSLTDQMQTMITTLNEAKTKKAKLKDASSWTVVDSLPASMEEADIARYCCCFGNLVGLYMGSGHAYFLTPTVTYTSAYTDIRPVVDVGSITSGTAVDGQLISYPYAYRKNIHVIYHEPDTTTTNTAAEAWGTTNADKQRLFSMINVDAVLEKYKEAVESQETAKLLDAYRLNVQDDSGNAVATIYEEVYNNAVDGYISPLKVTDGADKKQLPMIVIDTQYGTTDQLMTSILAALTGVGGVQNSGSTNRNSDYDTGINQIMDISVQPMMVENGVISADNSGRKASIKYSTDRVEISDNGYDTAEENGDGTFSLLTITYKQKDYEPIDATTNVTGETVTLQIPIFVIERLTIDTHLKIAEGEVYNADTAKEKGLCTAPLLANNSSYTLYTEYIYGDARNKYSTDDNPVSIDKTIGMTYKDENDNVCQTDFWAGTRLTLIDVCDSDKVYYYTVTGTEGRTIKYTDFTDADGNPYVNKPIHGTDGMEIYSGTDKFVTEDAEKIDNAYVDKTFEYENVAVERFLIVVDTTQVDEELKNTTSDIREYEITPELSENIMKRTTLTEHTDLQITRQPGLTIGLIDPGQENEPKVDGMIEPEGSVVIDATFQIEGNSQYWARVLTSQTTTIDSANHYKYLEVGIYLTDKNGNRVKLPDNTNIKINGKQLQPWEEVTKDETNLGAYVNQSTAYFYKDGRITFPLDALKDMIQKEMDENAGRTKGIVTENCKFELSFSNANLTEYTENEYEVHLELLRIDEAEYPAGGEIIDTYVGTVPAARKTDLACAVETEDLMELGINTYNQQTPMPHTINFDFKLDFNGIITNNQTMNQQIADKYYTVTYRILEKTNRNGTPQYEPYTGDQLSLSLVNPPAAEQQELIKGASSTGTESNSVYVTYQFDWSEIKNGTDKKAEGVITRDLKLTVNDAEQMDLSNYKIQASVMVSDNAPGDIDQVVNNSLSDFFVFTVAKLKTDLDY